MNIATNVPPRIAPKIDEIMSSIPGTFPLAPIEIAPRIITRKENRTPPQPSPTTVLDPLALNAEAAPPTSKVTPADRMPKTPAIKDMIPPAFCIFS